VSLRLVTQALYELTELLGAALIHNNPILGAGCAFVSRTVPRAPSLALERCSRSGLERNSGSNSKAEAEAVNYSGGAIQAIIAARRQVLRLTQDALKQKRQTVLRRIDLKITFDAKAVPVASIEDLRAIELDIAAQESKAAAARAEADRYSGGLLQSLALMKAATEEFSTATLRMKLYTSKYGIGLPLAPEGAVEAKPAPAGKVVKDRDAL
jgi:hypothetical protein